MKRLKIIPVFFMLSLLFTSTTNITASDVILIDEISIENCADCKIDNNLTLTATAFVSKCCKGSVRSVFPGSMWSKTVSDIKKNRSKSDDYKTAWKLISRNEYRK